MEYAAPGLVSDLVYDLDADYVYNQVFDPISDR
jgi:hypothetical protein